MTNSEMSEMVELVESVHQLTYARPSERTFEAMFAEGRGTCALKHQYLAAEFAMRFPDSRPRIVHRVYRVNRDQARSLFGEHVVHAVPEEGVVDVHCYVRITLDGRDVTIDVTHPGPAWDGQRSMPVAAADGVDYVCFGNPVVEKSRLERENCDPRVREPFISALAGSAITL